MKKLLLLKFIFLINIINLFSQDIDFVKLEALPTKSIIKTGEEFQVQLNVNIIDYWYIYSTKEQLSDEGIGPSPSSIDFNTNEKLELIGEVLVPKTKSKMDEGFEMMVDYFSGKVQFVLNARAKEDIDFSIDSIFVNLFAQFCDTVQCMPPSDYLIKINANTISEVRVGMQAFVPPSKELTNSEKSNNDFENEEEGDLLAFLLMAAGFGMAAWVMPCVFPMIPITVSFFTKRSEKTNSKGIFDASLYLIGIVITFTLIGVLAGVILGPSGGQDIATNPLINLVLAVVFIAIALSLFGAFEIQIPTSWVNRLNLKTQGTGKFPIIMMGVVFSLTSFACTVPFVATIMANIDDGLLRSTLGFMVYSIVFASPFFFFALFPSMMKKLPKSGGWMNNVKVVMGFLELAFAVKFLSNMDMSFDLGLLPRDIFLSIWIGCSVLIVFYVLGLFKLKSDSHLESVGPVRALWAVIFTSITIFLLSGLYGKSLGELDAFLPPDEYGVSVSASSSSIGMDGLKTESKKLKWIRNLEEGLLVAKKENKNVFVDFTGWMCTNCRLMEKKVFVKSKIHNALENYVLIKLYTDRQNEEEEANKNYQIENFNIASLPFYVIMTPEQNVIATEAFTRDENKFLDFLNKGIN